MDTRMIYEHLMRKAFNVETRKELWFADADYYDNLEKHKKEIIAYITSALAVLRTENEKISQLIQKLSELEDKEDNSSVATEINNIVIEISKINIC